MIPNLTSGGIQTQVLHLARAFQKEHGAKVVIYGLVSKENQFTKLLENESLAYDFRPDLGNLIWNYDDHGLFKKMLTWLKVWIILISQGRAILFPYGKRIDTFFNAIWRLTFLKASFSFERGGHIHPVAQKNSFFNRLSRLSSPIYVSNSYHGQKAMSIIKEIPEESIFVIRNGFQNISTHTGHVPHFLLDQSKKYLMVTMLANFFPEKDHLFVIESWSCLPEEIKSKTRLVFAGKGGGDICDLNFVNAKSLVNNLDLQDEIYFLESVDYIPQLLEITDIGLLATKSEGCPNAILEYMGAGLPVIASNIAGVCEILPSSNQQFLFTVNDQQDFIEKFLRLVLDNELRNNLGALNQEFVLSEFSVNKMIESYKQILKNIGSFK